MVSHHLDHWTKSVTQMSVSGWAATMESPCKWFDCEKYLSSKAVAWIYTPTNKAQGSSTSLHTGSHSFCLNLWVCSWQSSQHVCSVVSLQPYLQLLRCKLGVVAHACHLSIQEDKGGGQEFKVILSYRNRSRSALVKQHPAFKKKKKKKWWVLIKIKKKKHHHKKNGV